MTDAVPLPGPGILRHSATGATKSLAECLSARRSLREYIEAPLDLEAIGALLWAGQGVTREDGCLTTPSAHALHPLALFLVAGDVASLDSGLYRYRPGSHNLAMLAGGEYRSHLCRASLDDQPWVESCAALIVVAGDMARTEKEFSDQPPDGKRGRRYLYLEAGTVAQNIALCAAGLEVGTLLVGGFDDNRVRKILDIDLDPLVMMPLGRIAD